MPLSRHAKLNRIMFKNVMLKKVNLIKNVKYAYNIIFSLRNRCFNDVKIENARS